MKLTRFLGRSPDTATNEDLRRFQLHLTENRAGAPIINSTVSALRFFFTVTHGRADAARHLTFVHEPRKLPVVMSAEEVCRLLEAAPGVKYKAALSVAYGAGLRVSEVVALKVSDIDSKRMMLLVEQPRVLPPPARLGVVIALIAVCITVLSFHKTICLRSRLHNRGGQRDCQDPSNR